MTSQDNTPIGSAVSSTSNKTASNPGTVAGNTFDELKDVFASLTPQPIKADSRLAGHMITLVGTSWMPRFLRKFLVGVLNLILPWSGKGFFGEQGSNLWFGVRNGPRFGHYEISMQEGVDGQPVVWLNYDVERNLRFLRRIRGEVRQLGPGIHLGKMNWKTSKGYFTLMYYTLSHNE